MDNSVIVYHLPSRPTANKLKRVLEKQEFLI